MKLKNREKLLVTFMVIAIGIWAFDTFYYTPQKKTMTRWKEDIKSADLKLKESQTLDKGLEASEVEVSQMEKKLEALGPRGSKDGEFEALLKHLAKESERLHLKIVSIAPQVENRISPKEKGESPPSPYGKVPILLVLHSDFYSLGDFLKGIEDLPLPLGISGLQIEKVEEINPVLKATIGLTLYTYSTERNNAQ
jgi:Tfp pilus assembly protein PilO